MAELKESKAALEEDLRVRQELEKNLAKFEKLKKFKSEGVEAEAEAKDDDDDCSESVRSCRGSGSCSVNDRYYEYMDLADDISMVLENATLKKKICSGEEPCRRSRLWWAK
jgi:hypothetical protein